MAAPRWSATAVHDRRLVDRLQLYGLRMRIIPRFACRKDN